MDYALTIKHKESELEKLFAGEKLSLRPSVHLEGEVAKSRSKAKLAVFGDIDHIQFGIFNSKQEFLELEHCPLHQEGMNEFLTELKKDLKAFNIIPYDIMTKKGELKYIILSKSLYNDSLLLRFTLRSKESLDRLKKLVPVLQEKNKKLTVVTANIQPDHKAIFEGEVEIVLSEEAGIYHQFDDVTLKLGPRSFFQVTPKIAKELYANVGERVRDYQITSFLDLYSGVGAFSFFAARYAQDVKGVEISKEAIDSAKAAVSLNQISGKIDFVAEDVEKYLKEHKQQSEAILVNPPRRGLNPEIIKSLLDYAPEYLFYSSCNAKSLREDYELLKGQYGIVSTQVFDMFPYTEHYETLMVLKKHR